MRQRNKAEYQYDPKLFRSDKNSTGVPTTLIRSSSSSVDSAWPACRRAVMTAFIFIAVFFFGFILACYAAVEEWEIFRHGVRFVLRIA